MQYFSNQIPMEPAVIDPNLQTGPMMAPPLLTNPNANLRSGAMYPPMSAQQNFGPMVQQDDPLAASLMRGNGQQQIQTIAPNPSKPAVYQIPTAQKNMAKTQNFQNQQQQVTAKTQENDLQQFFKQQAGRSAPVEKEEKGCC